MNRLAQRALWIVLTLAAVCQGAPRAAACTGIRLRANDGAVIYARTLEFGTPLDSAAIIIPRGFAMQGTAPSGKPGLAWETKYGAVGLNGLGRTLLVDGLNEKGLAGGMFYMPGHAKYQEVAPGEESRALAPWELLAWILSNFATVDEVRSAVDGVRVGNVVLGDWGFVPPVHYVVHDATGNSLVIEYIAGQLNLHDNPVGVITNAPEFDWHITNLSNYLNLSPANAPPVDVNGLKIAQLGQGSGMLGLPGDFTPPSRFVRAALLSRLATPGETGEQAIDQAFHVLNSFDIPRGVIRENEANGSHADNTQWTSAADTKSLAYYFHTYDDRRIRRVDLPKVNLGGKRIVAVPTGQPEDVQDLTPMVGGQ